MKLRLLSYNIRFGGVGREDALAETIHAADPDLVVFQEALRPKVVERLAAATGMKKWASRAGHSVGFMSRIDVKSHEWHQPAPCRRAFLEIHLAGTEARVFGVHLAAAHNNWMEQHRVRELRALLRSIGKYQHGFHVLAGDFNTLAPGESLDWGRLPRRLQLLAWIGGRTIQWQTVQIMLDAHYLDGFRSLHPLGAGHTFPTWDPHVRLDYLFVPGGAIDRVRSCEVANGPVASRASDHFPLLAEIEI